MSKRQSDKGPSQGTSPGRMNHKSHGKSLSFRGSRLPPLQRETDVEGARSWHHRQQVFQARIGDPPYSLPRVCSPGLRHPYPPALLPHPSASRGCTWACLNKLVITTLRKPDEPAAAGAGLLQEVPLVDLLIEGHLEHPDGTGLLEKTGLGWPHLCNWWEQTTELPQQLEKTNTCLPSHGGWTSLTTLIMAETENRDDSKYK